MNIIPNLAIAVYTNKAYVPILNLFLHELFRLNRDINIPIYAISNEFESEKVYEDKVVYLDSKVEWHSQGNNFSDVLRKTLPQIKEDYIFWFCDDYVLTDSIDIQKLSNLLRLVQDENLDIFSFASIPQASSYIKMDISYDTYEFPNEIFYYTDNNYLHKFSVQPCIWKKSSLIKIVSENQISLHDMDCSRIQNSEQYLAGCTTYRIFDVCPTCPERFIISYIEVIRHGVFQLVWNGAPIYEEWPQHNMLVDIILYYNLHKKEEYKRFLNDESILQLNKLNTI